MQARGGYNIRDCGWGWAREQLWGVQARDSCSVGGCSIRDCRQGAAMALEIAGGGQGSSIGSAGEGWLSIIQGLWAGGQRSVGECGGQPSGSEECRWGGYHRGKGMMSSTHVAAAPAALLQLLAACHRSLLLVRGGTQGKEPHLWQQRAACSSGATDSAPCAIVMIRIKTNTTNNICYAKKRAELHDIFGHESGWCPTCFPHTISGS